MLPAGEHPRVSTFLSPVRGNAGLAKQPKNSLLFAPWSLCVGGAIPRLFNEIVGFVEKLAVFSITSWLRQKLPFVFYNIVGPIGNFAKKWLSQLAASHPHPIPASSSNLRPVKGSVLVIPSILMWQHGIPYTPSF